MNHLNQIARFYCALHVFIFFEHIEFRIKGFCMFILTKDLINSPSLKYKQKSKRILLKFRPTTFLLLFIFE